MYIIYSSLYNKFWSGNSFCVDRSLAYKFLRECDALAASLGSSNAHVIRIGASNG